jgi:hypothetical protein
MTATPTFSAIDREEIVLRRARKIVGARSPFANAGYADVDHNTSTSNKHNFHRCESVSKTLPDTFVQSYDISQLSPRLRTSAHGPTQTLRLASAFVRCVG